MKKGVALLAICLTVSLILTGCQSRSFVTEKALVEMANRYCSLFAKKEFGEVMPMLTGEHLSAMRKSLPVLEATSSAIQTEISDWQGKCDFINKDKTRASVIATYVQRQTVDKVGTSTDQFTVVYEFIKIKDDWKIYSVKIADKTPVK